MEGVGFLLGFGDLGFANSLTFRSAIAFAADSVRMIGVMGTRVGLLGVAFGVGGDEGVVSSNVYQFRMMPVSSMS